MFIIVSVKYSMAALINIGIFINVEYDIAKRIYKIEFLLDFLLT